MKVLGIVCSPRKGGNTEILVKEALAAAREAGSDTKIVLVADLNIGPCDACGACEADGNCVVDDDMQLLYKEFDQSDGIILGTPVYFLNVSAQAKAVIDRTYPLLRTGKLKGKVSGALVAARRVGAGQVLSLLYAYFTAQRMVLAGGGIGYGRDRGEVREGVGGSPSLSALQEAGAVGRNVVRMMHRLGGGHK